MLEQFYKTYRSIPDHLVTASLQHPGLDPTSSWRREIVHTGVGTRLIEIQAYLQLGAGQSWWTSAAAVEQP